jgi:hypothetical protein
MLLTAIIGAVIEGIAAVGVSTLYPLSAIPPMEVLDGNVRSGAILMIQIGAPLGFLSYSIAGLVCCKRQDFCGTFRNVCICASAGSVMGVLLGMVCLGTMLLLLWLLYGYTFPPIPTVTGRSPFWTLLLIALFWGGYLGFGLSTFVGALYGALAKKFQPTASSPSTRMGSGASP